MFKDFNIDDKLYILIQKNLIIEMALESTVNELRLTKHRGVEVRAIDSKGNLYILNESVINNKSHEFKQDVDSYALFFAFTSKEIMNNFLENSYFPPAFQDSIEDSIKQIDYSKKTCI